MTDANAELKERVRAFWQAHPCGTKFSDAEMGTREFFARVEAHRYAKEWHIPEAADFAGARGLRVLEIGCGLGTDGAQFAKAGADYTGVDLTDAAVELARRHFELLGLRGHKPLDCVGTVEELRAVTREALQHQPRAKLLDDLSAGQLPGPAMPELLAETGDSTMLSRRHPGVAPGRRRAAEDRKRNQDSTSPDRRAGRIAARPCATFAGEHERLSFIG